jgi:hypothetical protein
VPEFLTFLIASLAIFDELLKQNRETIYGSLYSEYTRKTHQGGGLVNRLDMPDTRIQRRIVQLHHAIVPTNV